VVSGVLCALLAMASEQGWRPTLVLLALATTVAGTMELIGTTTGVPFGHYQYTDLLGYKLFGHVPLLIPPSWFMMLYPALLLASLRLRGWLARAAVAAAVLTLWDVALDAACTAGFAQWQWLQQGSLWGWLPEVHFYGMPLENWLGWLLTGGLISALFLRVQPDWKPHRNSIGTWLYIVQGALAAADGGCWWGAGGRRCCGLAGLRRCCCGCARGLCPLRGFRSKQNDSRDCAGDDWIGAADAGRCAVD
jgi:hypothetical protein